MVMALVNLNQPIPIAPEMWPKIVGLMELGVGLHSAQEDRPRGCRSAHFHHAVTMPPAAFHPSRPPSM